MKRGRIEEREITLNYIMYFFRNNWGESITVTRLNNYRPRGLWGGKYEDDGFAYCRSYNNGLRWNRPYSILFVEII
jgi:hypothetical protein